MSKVDDVAAAIVERMGEIDTWKLQKLVYYSQAWHLVWNNERLFDSPIEAWANGPVCRDLYANHSGKFKVSNWQWGNAHSLERNEWFTIEAITNSYGRKSGRELSVLTHAEAPWRDARKGLSPGERGNAVISCDALAEYYGGLDVDETSAVEEV